MDLLVLWDLSGEIDRIWCIIWSVKGILIVCVRIVVPPDSVGLQPLASDAILCDLIIGPRSGEDCDLASARDLVQDQLGSDVDPLNGLDAEIWDGLDSMARPPSFHPGEFCGRGGRILSRSGARSAAMADVGGLSGIHRLMNYNQAVELELLHMKGKVSNSSVNSTGNKDDQMEVLVRPKGGTQPVRHITSEKASLGSDGVEPTADSIEDGRETAADFLPPVAGVGLQEYIEVALSARIGSSKGISPGDRKSARNSMEQHGLISSSMDPFPPLSRLSVDGLGNEGDSSSSHKTDDAALDCMHDVDEHAGMK